ncbi:MAG: ion transporter [Deltaproteobacteria bacterium]|jgi:voltage-gated potassium channel|nr:ion transporter [Deltaproteobacteria bacterium]MBW2533499.1 ion transporter [Deltaproteobacteria bacterium]
MKVRASKERASQLYVEPRLPVRWDNAIIVLTVVSLVLVTIEAVAELSPLVRSVLQWIDNLVCLIFVIDFAERMRRAPRRLEFFRRNWIDLLGSIPLIDPLRGARLVRLVRLLRLTRLSRVWRRFLLRHEIPLPGGSLGYIGVVTLVMWVTSAALFYRLEHGHNESIQTFTDALWWSMTTLSTVGYGDLYPSTDGGRVVAIFTMVLGIGLLGAVAATVAAALIEFRDRGKRGMRRYSVRDHLLVCGWNEKALTAIRNFRLDPRHEATDVVVVADIDTSPIEEAGIRFVRGSPGRMAILRRANAEKAGAAIVMASDPYDPRSDHESALTVTSLRRLNGDMRIAVELVDGGNQEHVIYAGCNSVIDKGTTIANLLVRSVQDIGVSDVVCELLSSEVGSEMYRVRIDEEFVGKTFKEYAVQMLDEAASVIGIARGSENLTNPEPELVLEAQDEAFVVSREPPR